MLFPELCDNFVDIRNKNREENFELGGEGGSGVQEFALGFAQRVAKHGSCVCCWDFTVFFAPNSIGNHAINLPFALFRDYSTIKHIYGYLM